MGELAAIGGTLVAVAGLLFAVVQWRVSLAANKRQEAASARDEALRRDAHLTAWGTQVLNLMAELEAECHPVRPDPTFDSEHIETMAWRASALVDAGRLFFPRVSLPANKRGYRVRLLDEVLRTFYVARYLAAHGRSDGAQLRRQVWAARTRFVELLQKQVRVTLREVKTEDAGESVDKNPLNWPLASNG